MTFSFDDIAATSAPKQIEMPAGLSEDVKHVFSVTYTDQNAMAVEELAKAAAEVIREEGKSLSTYPPQLGHEGLRAFVAEDLEINRGMDVGSDNIFLSSGAGGACQTIVDAFIDPGDVVIMDQFCYHGSLNMFMKKGATPVHVDMDSDGMKIDSLRSVIDDHINNGNKPKLIYTIPVYHNPTGSTLSLARRKGMLEVGSEFGIPIVENESYADFRIDGPKLPPSMMGLSEDDGVMYISAFTKLLGCGLRLGFGVFPESARDALTNVGFGARPSHLTAMVVDKYLRNNKGNYVEGVAKSLKTKRDAMIRSLGEHFPPSCKWTEPNGGMMLWVELPEGSDTWELLEKAVNRGVKYNPGPVFRSDRSGSNFLRLTFSHNNPQEIDEGIAVLADVFDKEGVFK